MFKSQTTQLLLEEVTRCLNQRTSYDLIMANGKTLRQYLVEIMKNTETVEVSRLFATIDYILHEHSCMRYRPSEEDNVSPVKLDYESGRIAFLYYNHILEVSIMKEKKEEEKKTYFYYVVFSFPEKPHLYAVMEILNNQIPQFSTKAADIINDGRSIREIVIKLAKIFDTFCSEFVMKKKYRPREFSMKGLTPALSTQCTSAKKRKIDEAEEMYNIKNFKIGNSNSVYRKLQESYQRIEIKPCESAKLFAVILELLVTLHNCKIATNNEWPGGQSYDGGVYDMLFTDTETNLKEPIEDQNVNWYAFQLCLLNNGCDYFLSLRPTADVSISCVKKIIKTLVPSFEAQDVRIDRERISNILLWLSAIIENFVEKIASGKYQSVTPSFPSSVSGSQDEDVVTSLASKSLQDMSHAS